MGLMGHGRGDDIAEELGAKRVAEELDAKRAAAGVVGESSKTDAPQDSGASLAALYRKRNEIVRELAVVDDALRAQERLVRQRQAVSALIQDAVDIAHDDIKKPETFDHTKPLWLAYEEYAGLLDNHTLPKADLRPKLRVAACRLVAATLVGLLRQTDDAS